MGIRKVSTLNSADWQGKRHPGRALLADQDGEEALLTSPSKKGSTVTMGIRKVSVQNSADWQGEEAFQAMTFYWSCNSALPADQDGEEALLTYFNGMKGSTVTMGIRKVSAQNSADWQKGEASH
jgi:hypothetical protein